MKRKPPDAALVTFLTNNTLRSISVSELRAAINRTKGHCTWCGDEVSAGRRTWCSASCTRQWEERNDPRVQGKLVWKRDKGVCQLCGADTERIKRVMKRLRSAASRDFARTFEGLKEWPGRARRLERYLIARDIMCGWLRTKQWDDTTHLYEIDHITPVVEGGGLCTVDNLRTLCIPCHKDETKALRTRRKKAA